MRFLGVEFAPLLLPLERRLQTFGVLYYASSFLFAGITGIAVIVALFFTDYYYISLIYLTWLYYDRNVCNEGGRTIEWFRTWNMWRHFANYFPVKLIKTAELDPEKNYVLGYHPHGVMVAGGFCNFCTEGTNFSDIFPGIKPHLMTLEGQFHFPLHREMFLSTGAAAATKSGIEWFLTKGGVGHALVIAIGGAEEALNARSGDQCQLVVYKRKGFVKLCLKHGVPLVPVFSFGENDLFSQVSNPVGSRLRKFQNMMTRLCGFSPPIIHGRGIFNYTFGYLPYRKPIVTIVGKPIEVEKIENPTIEQMNRLHEQYLSQLKNIFDTYKHKYGNPKQELVFT